MSEDSKRRSQQITIRLDPKIMAGLHDIASRIGIAPTTVAGMAIGEYVAKNQAQFANAAMMQETMAKEMAKVLGAPIAAILENKTLEDLGVLAGKQDDWTEQADD